MKKVFVLPPNENWIVDRFIDEQRRDNSDISTTNPHEADVVWLLADWAWRQLPFQLLESKRVITTVHHIVPEKFGPSERIDFMQRDLITDVYHVFNQRTFKFIRRLTTKLIVEIPYWANQVIWKKTGERDELRAKLDLPVDAFIIGSFQRDTEGHDLKTPKLEKGPDLFVDAVIQMARAPDPPVHVLLGAWRRQYIIKRLAKAMISYTYIELPSQETINDMYQTLDLYLVTARHEGGPQSLIECGLLNVPCRSRPVGIAEQVLPKKAIHEDVTQAQSVIPNVDDWRLPGGYKPYRELFDDK